MTEQQRPDEEVEGHGSKYRVDPEGVEEDVEGHGFKYRVDPEGVEEDVEGHRHIVDEGSADDAAGHSRRDATAPDEGDDVGGHALKYK